MSCLRLLLTGEDIGGGSSSDVGRAGGGGGGGSSTTTTLPIRLINEVNLLTVLDSFRLATEQAVPLATEQSGS